MATELAEKNEIPSYGKVWNVGHMSVNGLFDAPVIVQEKVDGSQISFRRLDDRLYVRSKGQMLVAGALGAEVRRGEVTVDGMFRPGVEAIARRFEELGQGIIYRGEYLQKPKHNTLAYDRVPKGHIALFDGYAHGSYGQYLPYEDLVRESQRLSFDVVPQFFQGPVASLDTLLDLLNIKSFLGGPKIEGIVIKRYDRLTQFGDPFFAKYVSEAFKEKHTKDWKDRNPNRRDVVESIIATYATEGRWTKAIQHVRERGQLANEPRDIAALMREISDDFLAECGDEVRDILWEHFRKDIVRGIGRGFPEFYKRKLAEAAFEDAA